MAPAVTAPRHPRQDRPPRLECVTRHADSSYGTGDRDRRRRPRRTKDRHTFTVVPKRKCFSTADALSSTHSPHTQTNRARSQSLTSARRPQDVRDSTADHRRGRRYRALGVSIFESTFPEANNRSGRARQPPHRGRVHLGRHWRGRRRRFRIARSCRCMPLERSSPRSSPNLAAAPSHTPIAEAPDQRGGADSIGIVSERTQQPTLSSRWC